MSLAVNTDEELNSLICKVSMGFQKGQSVAQIAAELGATIEQVREFDIFNHERRLF